MSGNLKPKTTPAAHRTIAVLGATGSIGDSTLDVIAQHGDAFEVTVLTAQENTEKLIALAKRFRPHAVAIGNEAHAKTLREALPGITVLAGATGLEEAAAMKADITVCAIVGAAGLVPAMRAVEQGGAVALANKEALVCAGELFMQACAKAGTRLLPIDSEHNAIFQVLATEHAAQVETITLTASGGPFLNRPLDSFASITPSEAVAHPRWNMGAKISVDSATMMNKALELIEAHYLFSMPADRIDVLIHPESIVHSLVHYTDGSVLAQLGMPDMRIPIGYALSWPARLPLTTPRLDLASLGSLNFQRVDHERFPTLALAREALADGPAPCIAMNAANEMAVEAFLSKKISFPQVTGIVQSVLAKSPRSTISSLSDVLEMDKIARHLAAQAVKDTP